MSLGSLSASLTRKSRSNFYYAFLSLPRARREALYAVYAFCRTVDDAADLGHDRAAQRAELARWRDDVARCFERARPPSTRSRCSCETRWPPIRFPARRWRRSSTACEMDLERVRYERAEDLYPYCYRVASAVGLCCIEIFGYTDPRAREYAVQLGTALQLTNIIRDVGTDAKIGRVYLPQQDLKEFGVSEDDLVAGRYDDRVRPPDGAPGRARPRASTPRPVPRSRWSTRARWCRPRSWAASTARCCEEIAARRFHVFDAPHHGAGPTQGRDRRPLLGRRALRLNGLAA